MAYGMDLHMLVTVHDTIKHTRAITFWSLKTLKKRIHHTVCFPVSGVPSCVATIT